MGSTRKRLSLGSVIAIAIAMLVTAPAQGQSVNESNLWYGDGPGMEVVFRTGENLAYTEDNPKVDPRMTHHARGIDQAQIKIAERSY